MSGGNTWNEVKAEAASIGFHVWTAVCYESMAQTICKRLAREQPKSEPSVGLIADYPNGFNGATCEAHVVWYKRA